MDGHASISQDVLATYAADAAREIQGVHGLVERPLGRGGVRVSGDDGSLKLELHVAVEWGASIPELGRAVQERVREYVGRMTDLQVDAVDVVVDEIV